MAAFRTRERGTLMHDRLIVGLDLPTVAELIARITAEAEATLSDLNQ